MPHGPLLAFAALFLLSPVAAGAQDAPPEPASTPTPAQRGADAFAKVDTNGDGVLSQSEWKAAGRRQRGFRYIDADHDGKVTPDELKAAVAKFRSRGG